MKSKIRVCEDERKRREVYAAEEAQINGSFVVVSERLRGPGISAGQVRKAL